MDEHVYEMCTYPISQDAHTEALAANETCSACGQVPA